MRILRRNITLLFLLVLIFTPQLFSLYFIITQKIIEHKMQVRLKQEILTIITVDADSVIWLKKDKEILINEKPFDIKTIKRNGKNLTISGLYDFQEKKLKGQLQAYHHSKSSSNTAKNFLLLLFFSAQYTANPGLALALPVYIPCKQIELQYQDKICELYQEIIVPPPRMA